MLNHVRHCPAALLLSFVFLIFLSSCGGGSVDNANPAAGITSVQQSALSAEGSSATSILYGAFPGYGLWVYNGSTWSQLTPDLPEGMAAAGTVLYGDFGTLGLWKYNGTSWSLLTPDNPENIVASETALYGDFGALGLWKYNGTNWSRLTPDNPQTIAASGSTLYGGFGALGLWKYDGTSWSWLTSDNPQNIAASGSILYGDFGALGLWKYNGTSWSLLTPDNPEKIAASGSILYGDFGTLGLWKYNGANWSLLTPDNPENIAASGSILYGDFGALGLWKYDGANWSLLTPDNPSVITSSTTVAPKVIAIATSEGNSYALKDDGTVWAWGFNGDGQIGDGTTTTRYTPVQVSGLTNIIAIAAGGLHALALTSSGGVRAWGLNNDGQLGDGTTTTRFTPVDVSGLSSGIVAISAGGHHSLALTSSGGVKAWGDNLYGQLGDGTTTDRLTPVDVSGLSSGIAAVSAGGYHALALTSSGGIKAWGDNLYGQLGDGTTTDRLTPVDVSGLSSGIAAVSAGGLHSLALTSSGGVKAWGYNLYGQIGDGTASTAGKLTPVNVVGLSIGIAAVSAGGLHSLALTSSGGVKAWGYNNYGQLGDGNTLVKLTPVNVIGSSLGIAAVSAGGNHSLALTSGGGLKAWGYNYYGQLGDGSTTDRLAPVDVSPF